MEKATLIARDVLEQLFDDDPGCDSEEDVLVDDKEELPRSCGVTGK